MTYGSVRYAGRMEGGISRAVIPLKPKNGLTPISCQAVLERSACAPFIKERRMGYINATSLHRKSGPWGTQVSFPAWLEVCLFFTLSIWTQAKANKGEIDAIRHRDYGCGKRYAAEDPASKG